MGSAIKEIIMQDVQGCLSCLFMLFVFGWAWLSVTRGTRTRPYVKPKITSARITQADLRHNGRETPVGELEVEAGHSSHITRALQIPSGSWVRGQGNGKYIVQFDLPAYMFRTEQPQEVHDRWYVESLAQANGYTGKVENYERRRLLETPSDVATPGRDFVDGRLDLSPEPDL